VLLRSDFRKAQSWEFVEYVIDVDLGERNPMEREQTVVYWHSMRERSQLTRVRALGSTGAQEFSSIKKGQRMLVLRLISFFRNPMEKYYVLRAFDQNDHGWPMEHSLQALREEMIASMEGGFDGMPLDYTLDYVIFFGYYSSKCVCIN
jgi:hypothetical protein